MRTYSPPPIHHSTSAEQEYQFINPIHHRHQCLSTYKAKAHAAWLSSPSIPCNVSGNFKRNVVKAVPNHEHPMFENLKGKERFDLGRSPMFVVEGWREAEKAREQVAKKRGHQRSERREDDEDIRGRARERYEVARRHKTMLVHQDGGIEKPSNTIDIEETHTKKRISKDRLSQDSNAESYNDDNSNQYRDDDDDGQGPRNLQTNYLLSLVTLPGKTHAKVSKPTLRADLSLPPTVLLERLIQTRRDLSRERARAQHMQTYLETELEILRRGYSVRSYLDAGGRKKVDPKTLSLNPHLTVRNFDARKNVREMDEENNDGDGLGEKKSCLRKSRGRAVSFDSRTYEKPSIEQITKDSGSASDSDSPSQQRERQQRRRSASASADMTYAEYTAKQKLHETKMASLTMSQMGAAARAEAALLTSALETERTIQQNLTQELKRTKAELEISRKNTVEEQKRVENLEDVLSKEKKDRKQVEKCLSEEESRRERVEREREDAKERIREMTNDIAEWEDKFGREKKKRKGVESEIDDIRHECRQTIFDLKSFTINPNSLSEDLHRLLINRPPKDLFSFPESPRQARRLFREIILQILQLAAFKACLETPYEIDLEVEYPGFEDIIDEQTKDKRTKRINSSMEILVWFLKRGKGKFRERVVGTVAFGLDVVPPHAWFERYSDQLSCEI
ncbi:hypothetical protein HDU97_000379 [Phlyctochytrium planicorne]|nr:hypothetical protein HDU97_000379 [Phlyctochytrium planicorne]